MKIIGMQYKKIKFNPKISLVFSIVISVLTIAGVVFWYFIEPVYQIFLFFPIAAFIAIVFLFCIIPALKNIKMVISKLIIGILVGTFIVCGVLIFENIPLKVNFHLLNSRRLATYTLAEKGELLEYPFNENLLSPPKGQENLAFDGILYLDTPADKGAIFYFSTGFMSEIEEGVLYKPEKVDETLFKRGTKIIFLDKNWIYFKGKFENIFEKP